MAITVQQFIERLTASGLMSAAEILTFQEGLPPEQRPRDVRTLAGSLVKAGKITKYQAQAVYEGKTKGLVFGEYVVLDKLGEGGMGVVLKARHRRMKRTVAIKILAPAAMKQPGAVERFHREVEAAARLAHPNIVTAHDASEHQGMHYLVTEYVEGRDLAEIVKQEGPLEVRQAVECILQAARGLEYAHGEGVVHRDIKPGNLLLDKKGTVKILDMGLARLAGPDAALGGSERLTTTGQVMGTCDYMAPEQSLDTHQADARADIYSLGCTLYRLLTGQPPYRADSFAKLFLLHLEAPIPSLCAARPEAPEALDAVYTRMLAKKPEDRYQSMAEVVAELEAVSAAWSGHSVAAVSAADEPSSAVVARTLAFLDEVKPRATPSGQKKSTAGERTEPHVPVGNALCGVPGQTAGAAPSGLPERHRGRSLQAKTRIAFAAARRRPLLLLGIGGGLVVLLLALIVLSLRQGTLVVEIDEQLGKDVQVAVSQGGEKVQVADAKSGWTLSLDAGRYDLAVQGGDDQFQIDSQSITVTHGGQVKVKVTLKPCAPAIAPFDAERAKKYQQQWARQLGVPVEITNSIGMKLVLIPPGEFTMGEGRDGHKVKITKPFFLGKYDVTQEEWEAVMGQGHNPSQFKGPKNPVDTVSWDDCQAYLAKLMERENQAGGALKGQYCLPTNAQWEHACRAGSTGGWCFGDSEAELGDYAWYKESSGGTTHPVGQKKPNAWGLYDVHGNVWQWCADFSGADRYKTTPLTDPTGPPSGTNRKHRGGAWDQSPESCRSAFCNQNPQGCHYYQIGFRACLVLADLPVKPPADLKSPISDLTSPISSPSPSASPESSSPPPAVAPFDAAKAKAHQADCAKRLGMPVETTNSIGMKLVLIAPGKFQMGATPEEIAWEFRRSTDKKGTAFWMEGEVPRHEVRITRPFCLGMYPVTQGEYKRVMGVNPSSFSAKQMDGSAVNPPVPTGERDKRKGDAKAAAGKDTSRYPVESVTWEESVEFCRRFSATPAERAAGRRYRLPTEAEWEYACRAETTTWWYWGAETELAKYAWSEGDSGGVVHPVGQKRPNAWGLYDMNGDVWQWCSDRHGHHYYRESPLEDPKGPRTGDAHVLRGGEFWEAAHAFRSAWRGFSGPDHPRSRTYGFRVVVETAGLDQAVEPPAAAPPSAVAPFDAKKAKGHQTAWAKYLGVPVELTNSLGMPLVLIPPGGFEMGSTPEDIAWALAEGKKNNEQKGYFDGVRGESPRHRVKITKPFRLGKYPVTQGEYQQVTGVNPSAFTEKQMGGSDFQPPLQEDELKARSIDRAKVAGKDASRHPVESVTWEEAAEFCRKLSAMPAERAARRVYRLPTEAQWEYACRAGTTTRWCSGDDQAGLADVAWFRENAGGMTHPVGQKRPNAWGLHDMQGNVYQWCADRFSASYYEQSPANDPPGPAAGSARLLRGGYWYAVPSHCRPAFRYHNAAGNHSRFWGFRVVVEDQTL